MEEHRDAPRLTALGQRYGTTETVAAAIRAKPIYRVQLDPAVTNFALTYREQLHVLSTVSGSGHLNDKTSESEEAPLAGRSLLFPGPKYLVNDRTKISRFEG